MGDGLTAVPFLFKLVCYESISIVFDYGNYDINFFNETRMTSLEDYLEKLDKYADKWATCTDPSLSRKFETVINHIMNRIETLQEERNEHIRKEINNWCFVIGKLMYYVENCRSSKEAERLKKHIDNLFKRVEALYKQIIE